MDNLHAVALFKHESFSVLQYAQDFRTIVKESMKRTTKWSAKYYTHDRSYSLVPQNSMPLSVVSFMTPLPSVFIPNEISGARHEAVKIYRPVRQRTVRSETTKGKAGALPPAVCATINHRKHKLLSTLQRTSSSFPYK